MNPILLIIIAILLPPLAVFLKGGLEKHFWINLVLFIVLPYIGGLIHAIWFLMKK
jgi:uncharacterized membrane protein YqaE (UPF0057 family)